MTPKPPPDDDLSPTTIAGHRVFLTHGEDGCLNAHCSAFPHLVAWGFGRKATLERMAALLAGPRTLTLGEVNAGADRATARVDQWPEWKRALGRDRPVGQDLDAAVEHFRPTRADLQARVDALRAELKAAETALAASYGPGVQDLARFLRSAFQDAELRRLVRYRWPELPDELPPGVCMADLCDTVACLLAVRGIARESLRGLLLTERPRRQQDIDAALASWGGQ